MEETQAQKRDEDRLNKKMSMIQNPSSMVILFRSRECRAAIGTIYGFDRAMNKIRNMAGMFMPIEQATDYQEKAANYIVLLEETIKGFFRGGDFDIYRIGQYKSQAAKQILASESYSSVIIPRAPEAEKICRLLEQLDPILANVKQISDFSKTGPIIKKTAEVMFQFHHLTEELSKAAGIDYRPSKGMEALVRTRQEREEKEVVLE